MTAHARLRFRGLLPLVLTVVLVLPGASARATDPPGGFVMWSGADTLLLERFERRGDRLEHAFLFRPAAMRVDQRLQFAPDGSVARLVSEARTASAAPGSPPSQSAVFTWSGDSVVVEAAVRTSMGGVRAAVPYTNPSLVALELVVRRALSSQPPLARVPVLLTLGPRRLEAEVVRSAPDSVRVVLAGVTFRARLTADGGLASGDVPAQGLRFARVESLPEALLAAAPTDHSAPSSAPYMNEEVRVPTRGGFALAGSLSRPRGPARAPAVLLLNGSGPQERDAALAFLPGYRPMAQLADTLARRGIAVLRLDDRGTGASGGRFAGSTSVDFADDAQDALRWLRAQSGVDSTRIAVLGHSEGGLLAVMLAAREPSLAGIILMAAPGWDGRRILEMQNREALAKRHSGPELDRALAAAMRRVDSLATVDPWLGQFVKQDPLALARRVARTPVLLLQGASDHQVSPGQATELADAFRSAGNEQVGLVTLPGTNHLFLADDDGDPERYTRLTDRSLAPGTLGFVADWLTLRFFGRPVQKVDYKSERERERELERERERAKRKRPGGR